MTPTPTRKGTELEPQNEAEQLIQLAREDLAQRLGVPLEQIRLVSVEAVEWRDASLGCPQPGMAYAQVITPGFSVVLEAEGERHTYHTDKQQRVVCCEPREAPTLLRSVSSESIKLAKEDLARRLGIPADSIDVVAVVGQEFPADAFYCRTSKERIARDESPAVIVGETILLNAAGRRYEYHASDQTVTFCRKLR